MNYDIKDIKKLREETGAGVMEVKQALEESGGDYSKAEEALMKKVAKKAEKKADRVIKDGLIYSYVHANGKLGVLVHMGCETDFVAKNETFQNLCKEVGMQICTDDYENVEDVLAAEYIRDGSKTIKDLIDEAVAKTGENIEFVEFAKLSVL